MDETQIESARERMLNLIRKSLDLELDQTHAERIKRENNQLYLLLYTASKLVSSSLLEGRGDPETEAAIFDDFTMAYHVYEEVTSQRIPHIDNSTLEEFGRDMLEGKFSRKQHIEEIERTNPVYAEYIGRVMLSWRDYLPIPEQVLQGCIDWIVLIPPLVARQNQKK